MNEQLAYPCTPRAEWRIALSRRFNDPWHDRLYSHVLKPVLDEAGILLECKWAKNTTRSVDYWMNKMGIILEVSDIHVIVDIDRSAAVDFEINRSRLISGKHYTPSLSSTFPKHRISVSGGFGAYGTFIFAPLRIRIREGSKKQHQEYPNTYVLYINRDYSIQDAVRRLSSVICAAKKARLIRLNLISHAIVCPIVMELTSLARAIERGKSVPNIENDIFDVAFRETLAEEVIPLLLNRVRKFWVEVKLGQTTRPSTFRGVVRMMHRHVEYAVFSIAGKTLDNKGIRILIWMIAVINALYFSLSYGKFNPNSNKYKQRSNAKLIGVDLSGGNFIGADLRKTNLSGAELNMVDFRDANLTEANLAYASLTNANVSKASLSNADLSGVNLSGASGMYADFSNAILTNANLSESDLANANFLCADLYWANLFGANLEEANLRAADLRMANLEEANLKSVKWDEKTHWPELSVFQRARNIPEDLHRFLVESEKSTRYGINKLPEKLSDAAKRALFYATEECSRMRHEGIGTEHILIGIIIESGSHGARILKDMGVNIKRIRETVVNLFGTGTHLLDSIPLTPKASELIATAQKLAVINGKKDVDCDTIVEAISITECAGKVALVAVMAPMHTSLEELVAKIKRRDG
ncbi:pentapeptide repeat-containing protein [Cyanobium sp. FGCU-6]|nr:pentapeptide repeat-containing protein [Cyanobium sp. FGCU6]